MIKAHYTCSTRLGGRESRKLVRKLHGDLGVGVLRILRYGYWVLGLGLWFRSGRFPPSRVCGYAPSNDNDLPFRRLLESSSNACAMSLISNAPGSRTQGHGGGGDWKLGL